MSRQAPRRGLASARGMDAQEGGIIMMITEWFRTRKARRVERRSRRVWDEVNFADEETARVDARTRAAVEREMERQQLSQWDVEWPPEALDRLDGILREEDER